MVMLYQLTRLLVDMANFTYPPDYQTSIFTYSTQEQNLLAPANITWVFSFCNLLLYNFLSILAVAAFSKFSALQELELPLNNICNSVKVQPDMFECLVTLDLSYNRLSGDDILALGLLRSLRSLHLTGTYNIIYTHSTN